MKTYIVGIKRLGRGDSGRERVRVRRVKCTLVKKELGDDVRIIKYQRLLSGDWIDYSHERFMEAKSLGIPVRRINHTITVTRS